MIDEFASEIVMAPDPDLDDAVPFETLDLLDQAALEMLSKEHAEASRRFRFVIVEFRQMEPGIGCRKRQIELVGDPFIADYKQKISPAQLIDFLDAAVSQIFVQFHCQKADEASIEAQIDHHVNYTTTMYTQKKIYYFAVMWYYYP